MVKKNPLLEPAEALLTERGFAQVGPESYEREQAPGVTGIVWLNAAPRSHFVDVSPKVGVRHEELTRKVLELTGLRTLPMTHWRSLFALHPTKMPDASWSIVIKGEDEHNAVFWDWFATQLDTYGEPWLATYADPGPLKQAMRSLEAGGFSRVTLPVQVWLEGDADGAREALEWGRSAERPPIADYDAFAARLLAEIEAAS